MPAGVGQTLLNQAVRGLFSARRQRLRLVLVPQPDGLARTTSRADHLLDALPGERLRTILDVVPVLQDVEDVSQLLHRGVHGATDLAGGLAVGVRESRRDLQAADA